MYTVGFRCIRHKTKIKTDDFPKFECYHTGKLYAINMVIL